MDDEGDNPEIIEEEEEERRQRSPRETAEPERQQDDVLQSPGDGESNTTCMICMEDWTVGTAHRICCLRCGHLFGRACIERWIKEKGAHAKCPSCNKTAKKADIRDIWCKTVKATDSTDLAELQNQLAYERKLRKTESASLYHFRQRYELASSIVEDLKRDIIARDNKIAKLESVIKKLNKLRQQDVSADGTGDQIDLDSIEIESEQMAIETNVQPQEVKGKFHFAEKLESSAAGGCKAFAVCPTSSIILVAQPSPPGTPNVFGNFGLRKYSIFDTNVREFIPLHSKIITSIQLKEHGALVLTSSMDKKVKLTNTNNNACIQTYNCSQIPTCVSWSTHRDQQFYVGSGNCYVSLYDLRNTSEFIYQTSQKVANTRLLSLASVSSPGSLNGVLVNDTRGSQFLEISDESSYQSQNIDQSVEHMKNHQLPFDGLMGMVDYHRRTNLALITTRQSQVSQNATHNLVRFCRKTSEDGSQKIECESVRTFIGGRSPELLSQSRILTHPTLDEGVLVGACDDTARGIKIWDASDNTVYQSIRTDVFVRDMICYTPENTNQHLLYALSEKGLSIYKWDWA